MCNSFIWWDKGNLYDWILFDLNSKLVVNNGLGISLIICVIMKFNYCKGFWKICI